jgi:probable HAF family extracellular repeat protein
MKKIPGPVLLFASAALLFASATGKFTFRPIGSYPNSSFDYPRSLNLSKTVVGLYEPPGGFYHGYVQDGKHFKTIEPSGALSSFLEGISDKGEAVGGYCDTLGCNPSTSQHGYLFSNGKYTKIDYPVAGYSTAAEGINNLGQVVGGYCSPSLTCPLGLSPSNHAFLLSNGQFSTLDFPGALGTLALAVNDVGSIAGFYEDPSTQQHGYLYQNGVYTTVDFPNANWTIPLGINNAGVISGIYEDNTTLITHGFTYANGVFTQIDVPNSTATGVGGINNRGDITATANVNNLSIPFIGTPAQ